MVYPVLTKQPRDMLMVLYPMPIHTLISKYMVLWTLQRIMLKEKYHVNIPIYITENGYCQEDAPREIVLKDDARIAYCTEVLEWVHKAMQDGIDVRGYYLWSLLDNFEWTAGYTLRYGIFYTDFQTQERIPKKSAAWYKALIEKNGF